MEDRGEKRGGIFPSGAKRYWLLFLAALGVLLLLFGDRIPALLSGETQTSQTETGKEIENGEEAALQRYAAALTQEIEALCGAVSGAGQVRAAISLDGGFTYLYAADSEQREDGEGQLQRSESYITVGNGAGERAVIVTCVPPAIRGIGIVCSGGADATVRAEIVSLLSAAYDVGSNRIYVTSGGS